MHQPKFSPDLPEPNRPVHYQARPASPQARTPVQGPTAPRPDLANGYASHELSAERPGVARTEEQLTRSALDRHADALKAVALEMKMMFPVACELLAELKRRA